MFKVILGLMLCYPKLIRDMLEKSTSSDLIVRENVFVSRSHASFFLQAHRQYVKCVCIC